MSREGWTSYFITLLFDRSVVQVDVAGGIASLLEPIFAPDDRWWDGSADGCSFVEILIVRYGYVSKSMR